MSKKNKRNAKKKVGALKALKNKISRYFNDLTMISVAESNEEFGSRSEVDNIVGDGAKPSGFFKMFQHQSTINLRFYEVMLEEWQDREIFGWISSLLKLGQQQFFVSQFQNRGIVNLKTLNEMSLKDFHDLLQEIDSEIPIKISEKAHLIINFRYFKFCYKKKKNFDKHFSTILEKIMENVQMNEYTLLLNSIGDFHYYGKRKIEGAITVIVFFIYEMIDREILMAPLNQFFSKLLKKKESKKGEKGLLQIKLIVIDQVVDESSGNSLEKKVLDKKTKRWLSPLVNLIPFLGKFGVYHVGLCFGSQELFVEWTTSSFIQIKELKSTVPIITLDLEPIILTKENSEEIKETIIDTIVEFNAKKTYNLLNCNCQHFVLYVCEKLKVKLAPVEGSFKKFLSKTIKRGESDFIFVPSEKFRKKYNLNSSKYSKFSRVKDDFKFDKHEQLDRFSSILLKNTKNKIGLMKTSEWKLLRAFDETFWIKYFNCQNKNLGKFKKFNCLTEKDTMKCPFISSVSQETEIYKRIVKKNEEWNRHWYKQRSKYNDDMQGSLRFVRQKYHIDCTEDSGESTNKKGEGEKKNEEKHNDGESNGILEVLKL